MQEERPVLLAMLVVVLLAGTMLSIWNGIGAQHRTGGITGDVDVDLEDRDPMDFVVRKTGAVPESRLIPNYTGSFDGYLYDVGAITIRTNAAGFRDQPFKHRSNETVRVIVLGDSFTFGWGVNRQQTYPEILEARLNADTPYNVEVMNFGVPGYDTREQVQILAAEGLKYDPDLVLIGYTTDEDLLPQQLTPGQQTELERFTSSLDSSLSEEEQNMKINLKRHELRLEQYKQESLNRSWRRVLTPLKELERLSAEHGFRVGIFAHTYSMPGQERKMKQTAARFGWDFIDTGITHDSFPQYKLTEQDWHINEAGHKKVAAALHRFYRDHCPFASRCFN